MPGTATHGYDMVIEFAEQAIQRVVSGVLDGSSLFSALGSVLDAIPGVNISADGFRSSINFDWPGGISIPTGGKPVDIRLDWLNPSGTVEAQLRIVAGLVVDRTSPDADVLKLDLKDSLFFLGLEIGSGPVANALLAPVRNWLRDHLPLIPLLPVPVDRTTADPKHIRQADAILADASTDARDAIGVALTFGGGVPGDSAAFTSGLVDWGTGEAPGAIAVFMGWILRMLDPALDEAFDQPAGTFRNGQLTRSFGVGDGTTLTAFSISLQNGFLAVSAAVEKSGFCWSARGTVGARMRIRIVEGRLQVNTEVDDPDVELDIPWYCYLAAAVVGALGGLLVGGIIGGTVGAVLVPLLLFALEEGLEGTLDGIADNIRDTLDRLAPSVDIPATGIDIVFQSVEIDDITIRCRTSVPDLAPVRGAGSVVLRTGQVLDLDSGRVGSAQMEGGDLRLDGSGDGRSLATVCAAFLARTGRTDFDTIARWSCYGLPFAQSARVAAGEMWHSIHLPLIADLFVPSGAVFAVRTGQGRRALVQVVDVKEDRLALRWKTWETRAVSTRIDGGFKCTDPLAVSQAAQFLPGRPFEVADPAKILMGAASAIRDFGRVGRWEAPALARRIEGDFVAVSDGFLGARTHRWNVDGRPLEGTGRIAIQGVEFEYVHNGGQLRLSAPFSGKEVPMELSVTVSDDQADRADASRCVRTPTKCPRTLRVLPKWAEYRDIYLERVGVRLVREDLGPVLANLPRWERAL
ncbi:MAG TPA: hypothetical protein PKO15_09270 [Fibrobacteria bacterium]|nr:hypothetical protein [Fibrobacteria bacterium]HOX50648.1 hypothetical protein [Fibrobacteria bacterium]